MRLVFILTECVVHDGGGVDIRLVADRTQRHQSGTRVVGLAAGRRRPRPHALLEPGPVAVEVVRDVVDLRLQFVTGYVVAPTASNAERQHRHAVVVAREATPLLVVPFHPLPQLRHRAFNGLPDRFGAVRDLSHVGRHGRLSDGGQAQSQDDD